MNSRERLITSLNHKEPDRVPIDFSGTTVSGICWQAYDELRKFIGLPPTGQSIFDLGGAAIMGFAIPDEAVIERLHSDTIMVNLGNPDTYTLKFQHGERYDTYLDQWGARLFHPKDGHYFDFREFPFQKVDLSGFLRYDAWPDPLDKGRFRGLRENCLEALQKDRLLMVCPLYGGGIFEQPARIMPMIEWYEMIAWDPKLTQTVLNKMFELYSQTTIRMLEEIGDILDVYVYWDDLSGQKGPLVNPKWYQKFVEPLYKKLFDTVHSMTKAKIFFHCCGAARSFIPSLIEVGVDILNPIQISSEGMDPVGLKRDFGKDIVFWGGACDSQSLLTFGTKQHVIDQTRRNIDALASGGGYVFASIHNIQNNTPAENILAMFDTCYEYGVYS